MRRREWHKHLITEHALIGSQLSEERGAYISDTIRTSSVVLYFEGGLEYDVRPCVRPELPVRTLRTARYDESVRMSEQKVPGPLEPLHVVVHSEPSRLPHRSLRGAQCYAFTVLL